MSCAGGTAVQFRACVAAQTTFGVEARRGAEMRRERRQVALGVTDGLQKGLGFRALQSALHILCHASYAWMHVQTCPPLAWTCLGLTSLVQLVAAALRRPLCRAGMAAPHGASRLRVARLWQRPLAATFAATSCNPPRMTLLRAARSSLGQVD
eukprot:364661-Chlamydomonas_euryale.AAC.4